MIREVPRASSAAISASTWLPEARMPASSPPRLRSCSLMSYQARITMPPLMVTGRRGA